MSDSLEGFSSVTLLIGVPIPKAEHHSSMKLGIRWDLRIYPILLKAFACFSLFVVRAIYRESPAGGNSSLWLHMNLLEHFFTTFWDFSTISILYGFVPN